MEFFIKRKLNRKKQHDSHYFWEVFQNQFAQVPEKYDVAIAYSQGFATYFVAEKVNASKKIAWVNVDYGMANYKMQSDAQFYRKYYRVVAVSEFLKKQLTSLFSNHEVKVPVEVMYDITSQEEVLEQATEIPAELKNDKINLLTVGRMVPLKGYDLAVQAADILRSRGRDYCWYFIGSGSDFVRIQNLIYEKKLKDQVKLLGFRENPYAYMKACDIYVQPSRYEGWGLTLVEAKILGKPVVTTNFPTAYEIISDGETGFICEMTAEALAEKIELLINDKELRAQLAKNNIEEVTQRNKTTLDRFLLLITQLQ